MVNSVSEINIFRDGLVLPISWFYAGQFRKERSVKKFFSRSLDKSLVFTFTFAFDSRAVIYI